MGLDDWLSDDDALDAALAGLGDPVGSTPVVDAGEILAHAAALLEAAAIGGAGVGQPLGGVVAQAAGTATTQVGGFSAGLAGWKAATVAVGLVSSGFVGGVVVQEQLDSFVQASVEQQEESTPDQVPSRSMPSNFVLEKGTQQPADGSIEMDAKSEDAARKWPSTAEPAAGVRIPETIGERATSSEEASSTSSSRHAGLGRVVESVSSSTSGIVSSPALTREGTGRLLVVSRERQTERDGVVQTVQEVDTPIGLGATASDSGAADSAEDARVEASEEVVARTLGGAADEPSSAVLAGDEPDGEQQEPVIENLEQDGKRSRHGGEKQAMDRARIEREPGSAGRKGRLNAYLFTGAMSQFRGEQGQAVRAGAGTFWESNRSTFVRVGTGLSLDVYPAASSWVTNFSLETGVGVDDLPGRPSLNWLVALQDEKSIPGCRVEASQEMTFCSLWYTGPRIRVALSDRFWLATDVKFPVGAFASNSYTSVGLVVGVNGWPRRRE